MGQDRVSYDTTVKMKDRLPSTNDVDNRNPIDTLPGCFITIRSQQNELYSSLVKQLELVQRLNIIPGEIYEQIESDRKQIESYLSPVSTGTPPNVLDSARDTGRINASLLRLFHSLLEEQHKVLV